MNQPMLFFTDITAGKHGGNAESQAANRRVNKASDRARVLVACHRLNGVTCRELASEWGKGMNTISGRFSALKAQGLIRKIGVRGGCGIYAAVFTFK